MVRRKPIVSLSTYFVSYHHVRCTRVCMHLCLRPFYIMLFNSYLFSSCRSHEHQAVCDRLKGRASSHATHMNIPAEYMSFSLKAKMQKRTTLQSAYIRAQFLLSSSFMMIASSWRVFLHNMDWTKHEQDQPDLQYKDYLYTEEGLRTVSFG